MNNRYSSIGACLCLEDETGSDKEAGFSHGFNLVPTWDEVADGRFFRWGTGENRPHACGGTDLFEERGTGVTVNILFSDGKCGLVITVKGKKNLLRYEKKNWKINVFIWIKGVFRCPFSIF